MYGIVPGDVEVEDNAQGRRRPAAAEVIQRQVEQELHNPDTTRRQLEELEEAREKGEISADEEKEVQEQILESQIRPKAPEPSPPQMG